MKTCSIISPGPSTEWHWSSIGFLILILFFAATETASSQDLIVLGRGDSLNCRITTVKKGYIYFTCKYESKTRNITLPVERIKSYKENFFTKTEVPFTKHKNTVNYQKLRIGAGGGWSHMTSELGVKIRSDLRQYIKDLKSGHHFHGDMAFFFSENIGLGMKYSMFHTRNELDNIYAIDQVTGQVKMGKLKDDIRIHYIGPSFCTRIASVYKNTYFFSDFSPGYLSYKNHATKVDNFSLTAKTLGFLINSGVDFAIDRTYAIELSLSYVIGVLNQYKFHHRKQTDVIKFDRKNLENISRIDFSIGLKWNR